MRVMVVVAVVAGLIEQFHWMPSMKWIHDGSDEVPVNFAKSPAKLILSSIGVECVKSHSLL